MKKKIYIGLIVIFGVFVVFLSGKQITQKETSNKPEVTLTVYTISSSDTQKWSKVKQFETKEAIYLVKVKETTSSEEVFSNIIADGMAVGFGVSEEDVKQFNDNLCSPVEDAKNNKLIGIEFINFSSVDKGFVVANFDYGKKAFNSQKTENKKLYKKLYEAYKG
ncbi:hypothetical protein [Streptococcus pyogenes]|uniref:hypothetical protein n=1 Tax=Streptococcus pyogenes TaxID=1314 RepID=UPI00109C2AA9|nr:hypothetical protein [Streptococcus pyogenes]VHB74972.1 exported protein [Streptococcus pyogenes]